MKSPLLLIRASIDIQTLHRAVGDNKKALERECNDYRSHNPEEYMQSECALYDCGQCGLIDRSPM